MRSFLTLFICSLGCVLHAQHHQHADSHHHQHLATAEIRTIKELKISMPVVRIVYQRDNHNAAKIPIRGKISIDGSAIEARLVPRSPGQGIATEWTTISRNQEAGQFSGILKGKGGWYDLEVRAVKDGKTLVASGVSRVGIGEVFIVAGHSVAQGGDINIGGADDDRVSTVQLEEKAAVFETYLKTGEPRYLPAPHFVKASSGIAHAPFGHGSYFWSKFAQEIILRENVPVLIYNAGFGGTNLDHWSKSARGILFEHGFVRAGIRMPYINLYNTLKKYIPLTGIRAILADHGQNDAGEENADTIFSNYQIVMRKTREDLGYEKLALVVNRQTPPNAPAVRIAQERMARQPYSYPGPDYDKLLPEDHVDGIHLSAAGEEKAAVMWAEALTSGFFKKSRPWLPDWKHGVVPQENKHTSLVKFRVTEEGSDKPTPVMVCITDLQDSLVRIPPDGAFAGIPTEVPHFMKGVEFSSDKNWIGPLRMTNGKGNNVNRSSLYELKPSMPYWKEPLMYQTSGDFSIRLPKGNYRVSFEHGSEFLPISENFTVGGNDTGLSRSYTLQRWIDLPARGWVSGDVHVHHPTDKPEYKQYLLQMAKAEDVHIVNMLEMGHHLGTDFKVDGFGKEFRQCLENYCLISGQEDPRNEIGHIIGLNINKQVRDTSKYFYYDLVFEKLHLQPGALIGYAHFAWKGFDQGFPWHITSNEIDFIELLQFLRLNTADYYDYLNLGFKITAAAGSDFPWASTIGDVRTFAYTGNDFSVDNWFAALKAGNTFVSNGPALLFTADGKLPGTIENVEKEHASRLQVKALSNPAIGVIERVAIYNNDGMVTEKVNIGKMDSLSVDITHAINKSQWIAAVVYCENGAVAHTTPVYYVVDNKPTYDKIKAPAIIQKQVEFIERIRKQEKEKPDVDRGILERLDKAELYYEKLSEEIQGK